MQGESGSKEIDTLRSECRLDLSSSLDSIIHLTTSYIYTGVITAANVERSEQVVLALAANKINKYRRDAEMARSPDLNPEGGTGDCHLGLLLGGDGGDLLGHDGAQGTQDIVNCVLEGAVGASSLRSLVVVDFLLCMLTASLGRGGEVGGGGRAEGGAGRGSRKSAHVKLLGSKGAIV
jgi:hypothetical protein